MKAIEVRDTKLQWQDVAEPFKLGHKEVLIKNYATAVNRADLSQRQGGYPPPPGASHILGLECAGVIADVGLRATQFKPGDRVCALLAGGGYAERVVVPEAQVLPIPKNLSFVQAAAIPEVYATAYLNIFIEGAAQKHERVLIHAGASGVGTAAIHMCSAFGNPCWITASGESKIDYCRNIGADGGTDRMYGDFVKDVLAWSLEEGANVILDPVGATYLQQNLQALALEGRLVIIGMMGGSNADLAIGRIMMRRQRIIGSTLRARSVEAKGNVMAALYERVWPLFEQGRVKPDIDRVFDIKNAEEAHAVIAGNQTIGKVVLKIRD